MVDNKLHQSLDEIVQTSRRGGRGGGRGGGSGGGRGGQGAPGAPGTASAAGRVFPPANPVQAWQPAAGQAGPAAGAGASTALASQAGPVGLGAANHQAHTLGNPIVTGSKFLWFRPDDPNSLAEACRFVADNTANGAMPVTCRLFSHPRDDDEVFTRASGVWGQPTAAAAAAGAVAPVTAPAEAAPVEAASTATAAVAPADAPAEAARVRRDLGTPPPGSGANWRRNVRRRQRRKAQKKRLGDSGPRPVTSGGAAAPAAPAAPASSSGGVPPAAPAQGATAPTNVRPAIELLHRILERYLSETAPPSGDAGDVDMSAPH